MLPHGMRILTLRPTAAVYDMTQASSNTDSSIIYAWTFKGLQRMNQETQQSQSQGPKTSMKIKFLDRTSLSKIKIRVRVISMSSPRIPNRDGNYGLH